MIVGVARLKVRMPGNHSLKGKRRIIKSLFGQVRSRFNVAISEVGYHDLWQSAEIGLSAIGNNEPTINSALDKTLDFIERVCVAEIVDSEIEIIHLGH